MKTMANRIEIALERKNGGNQSEMARFIGVTPQAVQKWISGDSEPKGENLRKAAEFLCVSPAYLQFGDAATAPSTPAPAELAQGQLDPDVLIGIITVLRQLEPNLQRLALAQVQNVGQVAGARAARSATDQAK